MSAPNPPETLGGNARERFNLICSTAPWLQESDAPAVALLAQLLLDWESQHEAKMQASDPEVYRKNARLGLATVDRITRLFVQLGLSPKARNEIMAGAPQDAGRLDELLAGG